MMPFPIVAIIVILAVIPLNILWLHIIIRRAIKRIVKPSLKAKGLIFDRYKWPGMFSKGDFRNSDIDFIAIGGGRHWMTVYAFIYYKDEQLNVSKRVTARIEVDTWQSYIEEVVYSSEL